MDRFSIRIFIVLVSLASALFSCRREIIPSEDSTDNLYFPLRTGLWWEYDVDSTYYDDFARDTFHATYILREEIDSIFDTLEGEQAFVIKRYRKLSGANTWQGPRIWWALISENTVIKVEENNSFIKLNYPIVGGKKWNGNARNYMEAWSYTYQSVHTSKIVNGISLDSTVTVLQNNHETLIDKRFYEEVYAFGVGLVNKDIVDVVGYVDTDNIPDTIVKPLLSRIKSGTVYTQKIKSWGSN